MATIEAALAAENQVSDVVDGTALVGGYQGSVMSTAIGLQVIYAPGTTTGNFTVAFEAGFHRDAGTTFDTVAEITQAEVNDPITLTIAPGMRYRYRYTSTGTTPVIAMAG